MSKNMIYLSVAAILIFSIWYYRKSHPATTTATTPTA